MNNRIITVDGPSAVGKGTISRLVAQALHWRWLDSGSLYRLVAYQAAKDHVKFDDVDLLAKVAQQLDVAFVLSDDDAPKILLQGQDVTSLIRTEECGSGASQVAQLVPVRDALLGRQRDFATSEGLVADGRDMGTVVFPEAILKIFLTADPVERARRRHKELLARGIDVKMSRILEQLELRDVRDKERDASPLKSAEDAVVIDTSKRSIDQVFDKVWSEIKAKQLA